MNNPLDIMTQIQNERAKSMGNRPNKLDAETIAITEHDRDTIDIKDTPVDPMR